MLVDQLLSYMFVVGVYLVTPYAVLWIVVMLTGLCFVLAGKSTYHDMFCRREEVKLGDCSGLTWWVVGAIMVYQEVITYYMVTLLITIGFTLGLEFGVLPPLGA